MNSDQQLILRRKPMLGEMLVESNSITAEQLRQAQAAAAKDGRKLGYSLVELGFVTPQQLTLFISLQLNIPYINLKKQPVEQEAVELITESIARKYNVIPVSVTDDALVVAMEDPTDINAIDDLAAITRRRVEPAIGVPVDIQETIDQNYKSGSEIEKHLSQIPTRAFTQGVAEARISAEALAQAPVVRAIDLLIKQGIRDRASDIHIEPEENKLRIRFRIDGILHEPLTLPLTVHSPLISRLKIMAGMNIAERRRPQDGQISITMGERVVDLRVATTNTVNGEMMVLRILDKRFAFLALPELGFMSEAMKRYENMLKSPFGMVLTSGPTGSGKTTTLYASLNQLDSDTRKIITIEDPVEYHFANINQIQVNTQANVTFSTGLRACMRLDPDVILVGEIRDTETAKIAIQAALTGHLVLSSVHANDCVGVISRLIDLGVEPFLVASAIVGIVAQRMVRRICPHCARSVRVGAEERLAYEEEMEEEKAEFLVGAGCNICANTGYLGRTGIYAVMPVSESIRRMILTNTGADEIQARAAEEGMESLWRSGMLMVQRGITTPFEVLRNVYSIG